VSDLRRPPVPRPMTDVMAVRPLWRSIAARPGTAAVTIDEGLAHDSRRSATSTADRQWLGVGTDLGSGDRRVARQPFVRGQRNRPDASKLRGIGSAAAG